MSPERAEDPVGGPGEAAAAPGFVFGAGNLERPPLVLLAGMLGDAGLWDEVARRLNDRVRPWPIRIDLDDSIAELATSVLAQAPERFVLAGHSLGGIVALEVQRQAPERVLGLVLLNASGRAPSEAQQQAWTEWRRRTDAGDFDRIVDELASATLAPANAALKSANARMARSVGPDGFRRQLQAQSTRPDSLARLPSIAVPVLVLSGAQDEICPRALQQELSGGLPHAELVEVPGAGHMLPLEAPDAVADRLRRWLDVAG